MTPRNKDQPTSKVEREIREEITQAAKGIVLIGQRLWKARRFIPEGEWSSWLEAEFGLTSKMAEDYIRIGVTHSGKNLGKDLKLAASIVEQIAA